MIHSQKRHNHHRALMTTALMVAACSGPPPTPPKPEPPNPIPTQVVPVNAQSLLLQLPGNGLATYIEVAPGGSDTQVQLAVLAGSLFVAPGLAELAATVLLESSDPTAGRPSLRLRIEALGGTIEAKVGLMTTWFDIRIHQHGLAKAIIEIGRAHV